MPSTIKHIPIIQDMIARVTVRNYIDVQIANLHKLTHDRRHSEGANYAIDQLLKTRIDLCGSRFATKRPT